jgi:hypothetical protein
MSVSIHNPDQRIALSAYRSAVERAEFQKTIELLKLWSSLLSFRFFDERKVLKLGRQRGPAPRDIRQHGLSAG